MKLKQIMNAGVDYFDWQQDDVFTEYTLDPYESTFDDFNELVIS